MKKIICILLCLSFLLFSGCGSKKTEVKPITKNLSFTAEIEHNNNFYTYDAKINNNYEIELKATSNGLSGLSYHFSGNTLTEKFNKLEHTIDVSSLPDGVIIDFIYSVFSTISKNKTTVKFQDNQYFLSDKSDKYCFNMFLGQTGLPLKIEDKENGITVIIKNASLIK